MAALGMYDFRDPNIQDYIKFEKQLLLIQRIRKQNLKIIFMECTMPAGATMIAADAGRTDVFNGTTTPIIVYAISDSANDDSPAGTGALTVTVFGWDSTHNYVEDTIALNGVAEVAGTVLFERIIGAKVATAGSGLTAAGNITITNTGQTATYLTIPAGQIASAQAGKLWIPTGWYGSILEFNASFVQTADAVALDLANGANVWIRFDNGLLTPDELNVFSVTPTMASNPFTPPWQFHPGGINSCIDVYHQAIDTDIITNPVHYQITYVVYKEA